MKNKKHKKQKPNIHTEFHLSSDACRALSNALLFLLNKKDFSFEFEKISYDSTDAAEEKLFNEITDLTRGEVRATAKAIDTVLLYLPEKAADFAYIEEEFPNILTDLNESIPILLDLQPVFQEQVKKLSKMK